MNDTYTLHESARYLVDECRRVGIAEAFGTAPRRDDMRRTSCKCNGGCESVLECDFWYWIRKTPMMEREAARQVQIGPYRVDCLFDCGGKMVVVELDGAAYHDPEVDWYRDGDLLMVVDAVIRVPYAPVKFFPHAMLNVLASWYPRFGLNNYDIFCMSVAEFQRERQIAAKSYHDGDFRNEAQWLEWAEPNFEIWRANESVGWCGSPKGLIQQWDIKPIIHRTTCERHRVDWPANFKVHEMRVPTMSELWGRNNR